MSASSRLTNGFGIYVHVPFCVHKCSYCDFYSFTKYEISNFEHYTTVVKRDLDTQARWLREEKNYRRAVTSIFFGGGTPSLLPPSQLGEIFKAITDNFGLREDCEITLEANPETVSEEVLTGWREHTPINRVSMGAQSFQPEFLDALERLGKRESIHRAAGLLQKFNYTNFNLDLIFGIPKQDQTKMLEDIEEAASLRPQHISSYSLTLKPGHKLFGQLPDDDTAADLYEVAVATLARHGYDRYEISNFARGGKGSHHNLLYWTGGDYLGVGPSAASRFFWEGAFHHRKEISDFTQYVSDARSKAVWETTSPSQTVLEATFLELRTSFGVDVTQFKARYGRDLLQGEKYRLYEREGLIESADNHLRLTPRGMLLAETVVQGLV